MGKRRWIVILAVVAALTLLIAGTAYAAQGRQRPTGSDGKHDNAKHHVQHLHAEHDLCR